MWRIDGQCVTAWGGGCVRVCAEEGRREEGGEDRWAVRDGVWHTRRQAARWALEPGLAPRRVIHAWHGSLTNYDVRPPD